MLGAQLDDLDALAGQLDRTAGALAECQSHSTTDTNQVVDSVRTAAATRRPRQPGKIRPSGPPAV